MRTRAGSWVGALFAAAVFSIPSAALAAQTEKELTLEQATLFYTKFVEILSPLYLGIAAGVYVVLIFLSTTLSALICFGKNQVLIKTLKYYVLYLVISIAGGLLIAGSVLGFGVWGGLGAVLVVGIALIVLLIFVIPMKVYASGALRAFCFFLLHAFVMNPLAGAAAGVAAAFTISKEKITSIERLAKDFEQKKISPKKDYSKSLDEQPETAAEPEATPQMTLAQEGPLLKSRYAELKARFAVLDRNNPEAVNQYNTDYAVYMAAVTSYNDRMRQAQAAAPQTPSLPVPAAPTPTR